MISWKGRMQNLSRSSSYCRVSHNIGEWFLLKLKHHSIHISCTCNVEREQHFLMEINSLKQQLSIEKSREPKIAEPERTEAKQGDPHGRAPQQSRSSIRYVAKYKCSSCNNKWKLRNSTGSMKQCEECGATVYPYEAQVGTLHACTASPRASFIWMNVIMNCAIWQEMKYLVIYRCECNNTWSMKCSKKESQQASTCVMCDKKCMPAEVKVCWCQYI